MTIFIVLVLDASACCMTAASGIAWYTLILDTESSLFLQANHDVQYKMFRFLIRELLLIPSSTVIPSLPTVCCFRGIIQRIVYTGSRQDD